jgi:hypothetical protein
MEVVTDLNERAEISNKIGLIMKDRKISDLMKKAKTIANELNVRRNYLLKQNGISLETFNWYIESGGMIKK